MSDRSDAGGADADGTDISTADTMRERAGESRLKLRLLLRANRLLVAAVLTLLVAVGFVVTVEALYPPFPRQAAASDPIDTIFSTMITVIVTGTTLVVSINQLVLSQENGPLGDQRERMSNAMDFRGFTAELVGSPTPADPSTFLSELIGVSAERAESLRGAVAADGTDGDGTGEGGNRDLSREVDAFVDSLTGNADTVREQLDGARFGTFDVLFAALNFNYSWKVFQVERIADEHAAELGETERELLDELKTALVLFGPAREHVKTLYFEWALIHLSQMILYAAVPALAVAATTVAIVDAGTFPGTTLGFENLTLAVGAAFAVTVVPFMLFVSYVLRIATVAKRTLAIEPLILRESQR
jgi:hypothetical protein